LRAESSFDPGKSTGARYAGEESSARKQQSRKVRIQGKRKGTQVEVLVVKAVRNGKALWPGMFPLGVLEERRRVMGSIIFNLQYQNDARLALGAIFKEEYFRYTDSIPDGLTIYQGVDLAISSSEFADYFAIVTIGVSDESEIYVLDAFRARLSFEQQARAVVEKARQFDPVRIAVEATGYQAALSQVLASRACLPVTKVFPHRDKITRAWRLGASFENGKVVFVRGRGALADELLAFPEGRHDDLFDAFEMAVDLARKAFVPRLMRISGI
jgi:predicted phage terminase large subunit-like protein